MISKILFVALLATAAVFAVQANPLKEEVGWNELVNLKGLFDSNLNAINARSGEKHVVLEELNNLLEQNGVLNTLYDRYLTKFNKSTPKNYELSIDQFAAALTRVVKHNLEARNGEFKWERAINQFSDIPTEELRKRRPKPAPLPPSAASKKNPPRYARTPADLDDLPDSFDWRKYPGVVTPIKDQLQCDSCTQFATTAQLESVWAYFNNVTAVSLSPQEMMDCSIPGTNLCAEGAWPETTYNYMMKTGATTWDQYPYTGVYGTCEASQHTHKHFVQGHFDVFNNTEHDIKKGVVGWGPIYISINVNQAFSDYYVPKSDLGIFSGECNDDQGTHSVLVIGYGTDDDGTDYWIVKNSWNTWWGYEGYIKMARGVNQCDLTSHPRILTVPVVSN